MCSQVTDRPEKEKYVTMVHKSTVHSLPLLLLHEIRMFSQERGRLS